MKKKICLFILACMLGSVAAAQVTPQEAERLKKDLTPTGGERAGNKQGTIPAWTGGFTDRKGFENITFYSRRPDPFAGEKPIFQINAKNMDQYADKLSDGEKALLKKYPNTWYMNVYQSKRTFANPQSVYDNTFKNATRVKTVVTKIGPHPENAVGGYPYPIPKTGEEVLWNRMLAFRGQHWVTNSMHYLTTSDGKKVWVSEGHSYTEDLYYAPGTTFEKLGMVYDMTQGFNLGPPLIAGEGNLSTNGFDDEHTQAYSYFPGQRRIRKVPIPCCDTPQGAVQGLMYMDEWQGYVGAHMERMNFKLLGKKEIYVPYNTNMTWVPAKMTDRLMKDHYNPQHIRFELHRVWLVETTLKQGFRHVAKKSIYYIDEDSWNVLLFDRWDSSGNLWRINMMYPMVAPDMMIQLNYEQTIYDLVSKTWVAANMQQVEGRGTYSTFKPFPPSAWTPQAFAARGVR